MAQYGLDHLKYDGSADTWEIIDAKNRVNIAPAYSTSSTYAVGDMVLYNGQLYECNTAISTAEAWTAAHWTAVTVSEKLADISGEVSTVKDGLSDLETQIIATLITDTASGSIASFPDGADNVPVKSLKVNIEPVQSGSGDPSPTNIRPISGHTSAVVTRTGKNLFDSSALLDASGWTESDGVYSGNASAISGFDFISNLLPYTGQIAISLDCNVETGRAGYIAVTYSDSTTDWNEIAVTAWNHKNFTTASGKTITRIYFSRSNNYAMQLKNIQFEYGSATAYEPYNGQTVTIDLDGTRYGGSLDVGTGVLTVDRAIVTYTSADNFQAWTDYRFFFASLPSGLDTARKTESICEFATFSDAQSEYGAYFSYGSSGIYFNKLFNGETVEQLKARLGNGIDVVYPITPFTVQLTAQEVTTLLGQNNIWADTGDVEVEYRADTKLYIQKVINS